MRTQHHRLGLSIAALCALTLFAVGAAAETPTPMPPVTETPATAQRRVHVFISGEVQGVGFRNFTRIKARELGLVGWVRNLEDGRVEGVIEGAADKFPAMLAEIGHGPGSAVVEKVEVSEEAPTGEFTAFTITDE